MGSVTPAGPEDSLVSLVQSCIEVKLKKITD